MCRFFGGNFLPNYTDLFWTDVIYSAIILPSEQLIKVWTDLAKFVGQMDYLNTFGCNPDCVIRRLVYMKLDTKS